jgi:hypothetical protein
MVRCFARRYYEAIFRVACSLLEDAESYQALKGHLQRRREFKQEDPLNVSALVGEGNGTGTEAGGALEAANVAKGLVEKADKLGAKWLSGVQPGAKGVTLSREAQDATMAYQEAFAACAKVLKRDKLAFQAPWLKAFWRRNYDALMVRTGRQRASEWRGSMMTYKTGNRSNIINARGRIGNLRYA